MDIDDMWCDEEDRRTFVKPILSEEPPEHRVDMTSIDEIEESGPWSAYTAKDGRIGVASDDFTHDVILFVYGDFADDQQRISYAEEIAKRLNAYSPNG